MVICVCVVDDERELERIGVKDSKLLSPSARRRLYPQIKALAREARCVHVTARELNVLMEKHTLNEIEAMKMGELISGLRSRPEIVFIDSPDVNTVRFEKKARELFKSAVRVKVEHKADARYPVVAAASILAKVERDEAIDKIKRELGEDFGSGYSSDPRTIEFLRKNYHRPEVRKYVRKKWETVKKLAQRKLDEF